MDEWAMWYALPILAGLMWSLMGGCTPTFRFELVPAPMSADRIKWEQAVSERLNEHGERIRKLEERDGDI